MFLLTIKEKNPTIKLQEYRGHKMKTKIIFIFICIFLVFSCASNRNPNIPAYGIPVRPSEFIGGPVMAIVLQVIASVDPEIDDRIILDLIIEAEQDPDTVAYYVPSTNSDMMNLSKQTAILSGTISLSEFSIRDATLSMKRSARSGAAVEAVEEIEGEEGLTDEEIEILKSKKNELSDAQRHDLKTSYIYLAVSSAALISVPETTIKLIKQVGEFIVNPRKIARNPLEVVTLIATLKQLGDSLNSIKKKTPDVIKNTNALIEVLKVVLAKDDEGTQEDQISIDGDETSETESDDQFTRP